MYDKLFLLSYTFRICNDRRNFVLANRQNTKANPMFEAQKSTIA